MELLFPVAGSPSMAAQLSIRGSVHSWDLSVGVDGPGTRFVLFTAVCPPRRRYCENPETWTADSGRSTALGQVMDRVHRYEPVLKSSGGGVTVSGAEPLAQPRFTGVFLHECHHSGLHTVLDTPGYLGARASDALLDDVDLVLLDLGSAQPDLYRRITGHELAPAVRFAERLAERGTPVWIRFVLVPAVTDTPENLEELADYLADLPNVKRVDVLFQHRLGGPRYRALGSCCRLTGVPEPSTAQFEAARRRFSERGLIVT